MEATADIANLWTIITTMNETIQSLLPEPEVQSKELDIYFFKQILKCLARNNKDQMYYYFKK